MKAILNNYAKYFQTQYIFFTLWKKSVLNSPENLYYSLPFMPELIDGKNIFTPNPFQDQMTIEFERRLNGTVEFTDMQGKQCLKKSVSGKQIKIRTEDLRPGFYTVTVSTGNKIIYQTNGIRISESFRK
ncbi:MAG: T9SS type A sorting domain-containing protein [Bacteroidota bacterium]